MGCCEPCYVMFAGRSVQGKGEEVQGEVETGLLSRILITKMAAKGETLEYDCCLRSLKLDVFQQRNGAVCFKLALAPRSLSLGTTLYSYKVVPWLDTGERLFFNV